MKVYRIRKTAKLPVKIGKSEMCYDLFADIDKEVFVRHGEVTKVPLGVAIELPEGYHASLRERSGLASIGIQVLGGQMDNSYRGEYTLMLTKVYDEYKVSPGEKICQMKLEPDVTEEIEEVDNIEELSESNRGDKGFGSSGKY